MTAGILLLGALQLPRALSGVPHSVVFPASGRLDLSLWQRSWPLSGGLSLYLWDGTAGSGSAFRSFGTASQTVNLEKSLFLFI